MFHCVEIDPSFRLIHMPKMPIVSTIKVLIVDDDEEGSLALGRLIKASWKLDDVPLEIVCTHTMDDGLKEAAGANCTILDLNLPDSQPPDSIAKIKAFPPPVIVMTGDDDPSTTAQCMCAGANGVYVKGALLGFIPALFKALQQDVVRRMQDGTPKTT